MMDTYPRNCPSPLVSVVLGPARVRKKGEAKKDRRKGTMPIQCIKGTKAAESSRK